MSLIILAHRLNSLLCLLLGLPLNLWLAWLLLMRSSKEMQSHSHILLQTCLVDCLALLMGEIVQPVFFIHGGISQDVVASPLHWLPNPFNHFLFALWFFSFYFSILGLTIQFVHRYLMLCRNVHMNLSKYLLLVFVYILLQLLLSALLTISSYPSAKNSELIDQKILALLGDDESEGGGNGTCWRLALRSDPVSRVCLLPGHHSFVGLFSFQHQPLVLFWFALLLAFNALAYGSIIFCATRIRSSLAGQMKMYKTVNMAKLNGQIMRTLLIQAFLPAFPLFLCTLAVSAILFLPESLTSAMLTAELLLTVPFYWLPVGDPIVTIVTISKYRKQTIRIGRKYLTSITRKVKKMTNT